MFLNVKVLLRLSSIACSIYDKFPIRKKKKKKENTTFCIKVFIFESWKFYFWSGKKKIKWSVSFSMKMNFQLKENSIFISMKRNIMTLFWSIQCLLKKSLKSLESSNISFYQCKRSVKIKRFPTLSAYQPLFCYAIKAGVAHLTTKKRIKESQGRGGREKKKKSVNFFCDVEVSNISDRLTVILITFSWYKLLLNLN